MMEEGEQEKRGEGMNQQEEGGVATGGQEGGEAENEKVNISSPKEEQDEARKSSVEQEMERCIFNNAIKQNHPHFQVLEI